MYPYGFQKEPETPVGLRWCMTAFAVYMVLMFVQLVFGIWLSVTVTSITPATPMSQLTSLLMLAMLLAVIIAIMGVLVLIFYFLGFGHMYAGREELGAKHSRNMWISLILVIGAVVAYGIGMVSQFLISFSILGTSPSSPDAVKDILTKEVIASTISGLVVAALVAAVLSLSILALSPPGFKPLVFIASIIGTSTPGIVGVIGLVQIPEMVDRLYRSSSMDFDALIGLPSVISSILGIVTILIFLFVYFSVHMAIKTGQLKPIAKQRTPTWTPLPYFVPVMPYQPFQPMQPQYAPPPQPQPAPPPKSQP